MKAAKPIKRKETQAKTGGNNAIKLKKTRVRKTSVSSKSLSTAKKQSTKSSKNQFNRSLFLAVGAFTSIALFASVYVYSVPRQPQMALEVADNTIEVGQPFIVKVYSDSDDVSVNAVRAMVTYPADMLTLESVDAVNSQYPIEAYKQENNNSVEVVRAVVGGVSGKKLVTELRFTAVKKGDSEIGFNKADSVLVDAKTNKNILDAESFSNVNVEVK